MDKISIVGIDLAKRIFQMHGADEKGKTVLRKKLSRSELRKFILNLPSCVIAMEACGSSNYWGREFREYGHQVKLISPQFVKPFVKANKNDANDAEAIVEAAMRPNMRFVAVKEIYQQDIQSLHRIRQRLIKNRTALVNEIRGLLAEYGIVLPQCVRNLESRLPSVLDDHSNELTPQMRDLFKSLYCELKKLQLDIKVYEKRLNNVFSSNETCQRIAKVEGIGPITATALYAAVGDPRVFKNGRQFSAWLGLVPRQNSSGGKNTLLGISKRGDTYLRCLMVHGARSVLRYAPNKTDQKSKWIMDKRQRRGFNKTCVAIANKNARVVWALMANKTEYRCAA